MHRGKLLALVSLFAACASPKTNPETVAALVRDGQIPIERKPDLAVETIETELPAQVDDYRIGRNDVLHVAVVGHPEFSPPASTAEGALIGARVQKDGRLYLPGIDGVEAQGKTVPDLRVLIAKAYARFVKDPQITVEILRFESQKFYILGHVARPGVFAVDGDTTLLEGVALAGGILDTGDIDGAYVVRGGKLLPVSLGDILLRGDTSRNVYMHHGDLVYVPDKADWKVYVLGEVKRPGIVPMGGRGLTLADALAHVGGIDPLYANKKVIRVFRGSWQQPKAYTLSLEDIYRSGAGIALKPGDRIIVAPRGLANWNRTATLLLPFIQTALTGTTVTAAVTD